MTDVEGLWHSASEPGQSHGRVREGAYQRGAPAVGVQGWGGSLESWRCMAVGVYPRRGPSSAPLIEGEDHFSLVIGLSNSLQ